MHAYFYAFIFFMLFFTKDYDDVAVDVFLPVDPVQVL